MNSLMTTLVVLLGSVFVFGTLVGSFLNVCIYRIPAGKSVVRPRSFCPTCGKPIAWYQNIPIFSYLFLRGCCFNCGVKISLRYPAIEALTGALFVMVVWSFGIAPWTPFYLLFVAGLITITFIDLDHQIIPDVISLPGILVGLLSVFFVPWITWVDSIGGVLLGGGLLYLVAELYFLLKKKEGMGGGDIKLLAMIGAFLGWKAVFPVIFLSSLIGTMVGIPLMYFTKSSGGLAIPFGPFLSVGAVIWLFWGSSILSWYFSFF